MERRRRATVARGIPRRVVLFSVLVSTPFPAHAQLATATVEENLRLEPNGMVLARVLPGTELAVDGRDGRWLEVTLEGWVWARSLQATDRAGFDLVVSAEEGENFRGRPQGSVVARLEPGTLLEELERIPGWIRARRTGWMWAESARVQEEETEESEPREDTVSNDAAGGEPDDAGQRVGGEPTSGTDGDGASGGVTSAPPEPLPVLTVPPSGISILTSPDGDTLARALPGTDVPVLERRGGWTRVRVEGWAWIPPGMLAGPDGATVDGAGGDTARPRSGDGASPTPSDVRAEPERWLGRVVTWELQFVSLERAERVRTDFFEGEPFLLTRVPDGRGPFVYVAVAPERLEEIQGLTPLERLRITGRVRAGASALTGSPILDLLDFRRGGR